MRSAVHGLPHPEVCAGCLKRTADPVIVLVNILRRRLTDEQWMSAMEEMELRREQHPEWQEPAPRPVPIE